MSGNSQGPNDFDSSRINPEVHRALADHSPEIRQGVTRVADQPPSPNRGDNRPDWKQPTSNRRQGA
jgi:hypothetical protein